MNFKLKKLGDDNIFQIFSKRKMFFINIIHIEEQQ